jgi:hypothetical protein
MGRRRLEVTAEILVNLLKETPEGYAVRVGVDPLPADVRVLGVRGTLRNMIVLDLESDAWEATPESVGGSQPPRVEREPMFTTVVLSGALDPSTGAESEKKPEEKPEEKHRREILSTAPIKGRGTL